MNPRRVIGGLLILAILASSAVYLALGSPRPEFPSTAERAAGPGGGNVPAVTLGALDPWVHAAASASEQPPRVIRISSGKQAKAVGYRGSRAVFCPDGANGCLLVDGDAKQVVIAQGPAARAELLKRLNGEAGTTPAPSTP